MELSTSGRDNGGVYALNATSGIPLWNYGTGNGTLSSPAVVGGVVYVGSSDDNIYALSATNGVKLWNYKTSGSVGSPVVVNSVLYVGSGDNISALRVAPASSSSSSELSSTLFIIIGLVVTLVIVGAVVFLMFKKKVKTKITRPPTASLNSTSACIQVSDRKVLKRTQLKSHKEKPAARSQLTLG